MIEIKIPEAVKESRVYKFASKNKKKIINILEIVCGAVIAFGLSFLIVNASMTLRSRKTLNDLRLTITEARNASGMPLPEAFVSANKEEDKKDNKVQAGASKLNSTSKNKKYDNSPVLEAYKQIKLENENFYGWLTVPDTGIDYPIMHGPDNKFYLSHDINRRPDKYGMLILDDNCKDEYPISHYIVYGHNINSGKYFGELIFYKDEGYYKYHPTIIFDNIHENREFEVFAVFNTSVNEAHDEHGLFTLWKFESDNQYNELIKWAKEKSLYNIEYTPKYGEEILTLITCEHSQEDGRFIVMAARKMEQNSNETKETS